MFFIRHLRRTQIQGCSIPLSSFSKPWTRDCLKLLCCSTQMKSASDGQLILKSFEGRAELMLAVRACLPPHRRLSEAVAHRYIESFHRSQEVNRYLCLFPCWFSAPSWASTGSLSGLEGTLQARYRTRHRRRRRMATSVLQPMATTAAVDSPAMGSSCSITKTATKSGV